MGPRSLPSWHRPGHTGYWKVVETDKGGGGRKRERGKREKGSEEREGEREGEEREGK